MSAEATFRFVQFELPWAPGPAAGRYVVREHLGEPPGHVVVVTQLAAGERPWLRRRARPTDRQPEPRAVTTWRVTLIDARALAGLPAAADWLKRVDLDAVVVDAVLRIVVLGALGSAVYLGLARVLRITEVTEVLGTLRRRVPIGR